MRQAQQDASTDENRRFCYTRLMPKPIHEAAAKGFELAPDAYERGRPEYPAEAIRHLIENLKIRPGSVVVDLGAGTGKFTKLLLPTGARIIAVEPVPGMRNKLASNLPDVEVLAGTAESIPLPDDSVDAVIAAQAFHWFNGDAALAEIHRVLKPHGRLGLVWNARDESIPWISRLTEIVDPHEKGAPRYRSGRWRDAFGRTRLFDELKGAHFSYVHSGPPGMVVDRVASISFISALPDDTHRSVLRQVEALLASDVMTAGRTVIELPYRTDVFWCEKREQASL